jgi:adenine phosphoribosyltransferase
MNLSALQSLIREVNDFPKPGIKFKDVSPLLAHPDIRQFIASETAARIKHLRIDALAAVEARGFLFGISLADYLNVPFIPVRKAGKLPSGIIQETYALEYGTSKLEIQVDAVKPGQHILVYDDLLATGGTLSAAGRLIQRLNGTLAGFCCLIWLSGLDGANKIKHDFGHFPEYLIRY